ncbi:response regulator [Methylocucumis oryzae]|uniref:response regulator n=1 Tax=Methylocucumis oryzae TaxID=1632867 RepID=UPI000697BDEC|nr:response regulator [Methylocucumis oryzae]
MKTKNLASPAKLLIIENSQNIRNLIKQSYDSSYTIFEADNGDDAIKIIAKERPEIILVNIGICGKIDGFSVCAYAESSALNACKLIFVKAEHHNNSFNIGYQLNGIANWLMPANLVIGYFSN